MTTIDLGTSTQLRTWAAVALLSLASACANSSPVSPSAATETPPAQATPAPAPVPSVPVPAPAPAPAPVAPASARYEVVFESTWRAATHPVDFPSSAHYSGLVGGTHSSAATFWKDGALASEGIRLMAERGSKSPLTDEVQSAIANGRAEFVLSGGALGTATGTVRMEFDISQTFPLVTLVTMVAPSPDWFLGVSGLPLFEADDWIGERVVTLYAYDAGTDSGASYQSPDQETRPREPIARISGYPMASGGSVAPLGTFTFRRLR